MYVCRYNRDESSDIPFIMSKTEIQKKNKLYVVRCSQRH
jgi:hypothetical protein